MGSDEVQERRHPCLECRRMSEGYIFMPGMEPPLFFILACSWADMPGMDEEDEPLVEQLLTTTSATAARVMVVSLVMALWVWVWCSGFRVILTSENVFVINHTARANAELLLLQEVDRRETS